MTHQAVSVLFLAYTKTGVDKRYELGIFSICGQMILFCNSAEKYTPSYAPLYILGFIKSVKNLRKTIVYLIILFFFYRKRL